MIDTHTHSHFSFDSSEEPKRLVDAALGLGLTYVAVTEHVDYSDNHYPDFGEYIKTYRYLRENRGLDLAIGIECGYTKQSAAQNADMLARYPFDYVINSVHEAGGGDCYFPAFFAGKSKDVAYAIYYSAVLDSLDAPYHYDAVGHLGYITRNAPFEDRRTDLSVHGDVIDAILTKIIAKNKLLELNSNISVDAPCVPELPILRRYYELGGRLITFGSDAHVAKRLGRGYHDVVAVAKSLGFDAFWTIQNNQPKRCAFGT